MLVIGFAGKGGVGKSEMAKGMQNRHHPNVFIHSFATHLKEGTKFLFGLSDHDINTIEGKKSIIPNINITVRKALQIVGTDFGRNMIHKDFWVFQEERKIKDYEKYVTLIYDDVRFPNECDLIHKYNGIIIYLHRDFKTDFTEVEQEHQSEKALDFDKVDIFLNVPNDIKIAKEIVNEEILKFIEDRNGKGTS